MSRSSMSYATCAQVRATICSLLEDQTGSGALEYGMMLALVALGTTSVLGGAANLFYGMFQHMISSVSVVWPS